MNVREAAVRKLGTRSRTVKELKDYLIKKEFSIEEIDETIEELLDYNYLNDSRYCLEYFRYAFGKRKSKQCVFIELKNKGVNLDTVQLMYEEYIDGDDVINEKDKAEAECEKILRNAGLTVEDPVTQKIIGKIGRRLSGLGYPADIIYSIINSLKREK